LGDKTTVTRKRRAQEKGSLREGVLTKKVAKDEALHRAKEGKGGGGLTNQEKVERKP